jgi:hypothetical protein
VNVHEILDQAELAIRAVQVAGAVAGDAVAQDQVLCARRYPQGIDLHESQLRDCLRKRPRRRQRARDGATAQVGERHRITPRARRRRCAGAQRAQPAARRRRSP